MIGKTAAQIMEEFTKYKYKNKSTGKKLYGVLNWHLYKKLVDAGQYKTIEKLCFSTDIKANGWRRPALLKKLRRTFSTS